MNTETAHGGSARALRDRWRAPSRIWALIGGIAAAATVLTFLGSGLMSPGLTLDIPWWMFVPFFYFAELAVVHLRFRDDAHSFSMSEIPMVVGLFFLAPVHLVLAQAAGNLMVMGGHRRLPPVKTTFNLAQFALQTSLAVIVFRLVAQLGDPIGPVGWIGATLGALVALVAADGLINTAIRLSGGRIDRDQMVEVLKLSSLATVMSVSLALTAVVVLSAQPESAWLAIAPPVSVFVAYRAYIGQRLEGARLESLYEATRVLHRSPQIESALSASAQQALHMFEAEFVEIYVFATGNLEKSYLTAVGPGARHVTMQPVVIDLEQGLWKELADTAKSILLSDHADRFLDRPDAAEYPAREAIAAPLVVQGDVVGAMLVANRLGDVSTLTPQDVRLLETLASQVSVSVENGRLEDSLAQLTELKERLEELVRSKDQFVATVSHELRTPLTAILGLSEELNVHREQFSTMELDEMISLIAGQSSELSDMIEDLLVAARVDIGTLSFDPRLIDLSAEIDQVINGLNGYGAGRRPIVDLMLPVPAQADALRVRQILRNLLTNAQRYGGDTVRIEGEVSEATVSIRVCDDGDGVPEDREESIFEPYQSAHTRSTEPASVGLGLVVSRKLAQLMGGELTYLRRGAETVFELTLPTPSS